MLEKYAHVEDGADAARYPFWALVRDDLWIVEHSDELALTSMGRRPTVESLNRADPEGGLPREDYALLRSHPEAAAEAAAGLLQRYFYPLPEGLLEDFGLHDLLADRWADALRPLLGEAFKDRDAVRRSYGGQKMAGIGCLSDGILSVFADDNGPYADGRIPETNWIAYVGDGLSGDQKIVDGNELMAAYQADGRRSATGTSRMGGQLSFETWAVIAQRRRRWGIGEDRKWRREISLSACPVPSPERDTWPVDVHEALEAHRNILYDDTGDYPSGRCRSGGSRHLGERRGRVQAPGCKSGIERRAPRPAEKAHAGRPIRPRFQRASRGHKAQQGQP
ncbi:MULTISPECIES: hypothetical protein [unclassified Streptomyces]|uniref:hypothetical protein n=1 Tax=Streptomyces sp. NPDC127129 TaxID=3345373 RepID=UPI003640F4B4